MAENEVRLDLARKERIGIDEAILCASKSDEQIEVILDTFYENDRHCLLTRLNPRTYANIRADYQSMINYDEVSETAFFNWRESPLDAPSLAVITAGSSDVPVAREAIRTLQYNGIAALAMFDLGVAGLWRLLERVDEIEEFPIVIAVAGMDAALPTVLGGLYSGLIIAVPTSVGYGVAAGGMTALNAILASCASGVVTVNIDNGYGAACAAMRVLPRHRSSATRFQQGVEKNVSR